MEDRILVVGPSWVGDMVMAQTLLKSLVRTRPDIAIDVMAPSATISLVQRMPEVNRGLRFDMAHGELGWSYRRQFARQLKSDHYQQAIVLPNSAKSALVPFFAGIEKRTGFLGEYRYFLLNDIRRLDKKKMPRMIDRFISLGAGPGDETRSVPIDYPVLTTDKENQQACLARLSLDVSCPVLAICPGAEFGDAKKWPVEHYADLADQAISRGMRVWIFGSPADKEVAEDILEAVQDRDSCQDLTGKTTLLDVVDLLALTRLVVSNDSGLMHIAAAVGVETAVIYGSTSPDFTPPLTERRHILRQSLACSPCFKRNCPLGHKNCLVQLEPAGLVPILDSLKNQDS